MLQHPLQTLLKAVVRDLLVDLIHVFPKKESHRFNTVIKIALNVLDQGNAKSVMVLDFKKKASALVIFRVEHALTITVSVLGAMVTEKGMGDYKG